MTERMHFGNGRARHRRHRGTFTVDEDEFDPKPRVEWLTLAERLKADAVVSAGLRDCPRGLAARYTGKQAEGSTWAKGDRNLGANWSEPNDARL